MWLNDTVDIIAEIEHISTFLYQNKEKEGMDEYMEVIKRIIAIISPYVATGNSDYVEMIDIINEGIDAYKHLDCLGMADSLVIIKDRLYEQNI